MKPCPSIKDDIEAVIAEQQGGECYYKDSDLDDDLSRGRHWQQHDEGMDTFIGICMPRCSSEAVNGCL